MTMPLRLSLFACAALLAMPAALHAAPLILYDPAASFTPDIKAGTTTTVPQPCGLSTPCTDMNTSAQASLAAPLASDFQYGMSGEASAGVSNHGQAGSLGVLAWMKAGDTTLSIGLSVNSLRYTGQRGVTLLPQPHP